MPKGLSILLGESGRTRLGNLQENAQAEMVAVAVAIALAHQGFGAVVLALEEAIAQTGGQEVKKGENFLPPVTESRQGFAEFRRSRALNRSHPTLEFASSGGFGGRGIPGAQVFASAAMLRPMGERLEPGEHGSVLPHLRGLVGCAGTGAAVLLKPLSQPHGLRQATKHFAQCFVDMLHHLKLVGHDASTR